jgi:preprotein translocase subunit Sec63
MERFLLFFCFRSCLKGESNKEYYKILEIDESASTDAVKKAYKKLSLNLHPVKYKIYNYYIIID